MVVSRFAERPTRCVTVTFAVVAILGRTIGVSPACAEPVNVTPPSQVQPLQEAAQRFGIAESWIRAVIRAESGGDPRAVSAAGAMGMMQIMPATWNELAQRYGLGDDPFDVRANILAGTAYLRAMLDRYGDLRAALAAYNAGPARVDSWRAGRTALPSETVAYVTRIAPSTVGAGGVASISLAHVAPDWRTSVLFGGHRDNSGRTSPGSQSDTDTAAIPAPSNAVPRALTPPSNGLFIALSGRGS